MKKMFTLLGGLFLALAVMAADHRPVVTVNSMKNYKIVIDGRTYFSNNNQISIANMNRGQHFIQVFEMRRGYYDRRERLVTSTTFTVRKNDVRIFIDHYGDIRIREMKSNRRFDRDDQDWNDRDYNSRDHEGHDRRNDDRRF